jgi:hypothetical protein
MTLAEMLAELPDDTRVSVTIGSGDVRVRELREAFTGPSPHAVLTTGQAAEQFGYSADTWRRWAGDIAGAYQDDDGRGTWRLPVVGCIEHLRRLSAPKRRRRRGPWTPEKTRQARAPDLLAQKVAGGGSSTVGRRQADAPGPRFPRLAP